jgi:glycosyltransferase involved in cell wall biosynthesis
MKILHIISGVNPEGGGPIEGIKAQAEVWRSLGHLREVVSLDAPDDPWIQAFPLRVYPLGISSSVYKHLGQLIPWLRYSYSPHLRPWLREHIEDYDVIIVNGLWNYATLAAARELKRSGRQYFVYCHGQLDPWFRKRFPIKNFFKQISWWLVEGPLLNGATAVFFTTDYERILARKSFWPYRVREQVVGYGTADPPDEPKKQIAAFRAAIPELGTRRFLLFLSRIHLKKGCDILIRAFARIARAHPDLDLVIAGPDQSGLRAKLEEIVSSENLSERVHWPGMLTGDAKWGAFRAADGFVLPSHSENFGVVVAEALACCLPVLTTNKVNIWREVVTYGGGLVSNDEVDDFSRILVRFLALSVDERKQMKIRARDIFVKHFDVRAAARDLLHIIDEHRDCTPGRR